MPQTDPRRPDAPTDEVIDRGTRVLTVLLERLPGAPVAAIGAKTSPALVSVPASVPVGDHPRLKAGSLLDIVLPADRVVVSKLWGQARSQGVACGSIRLLERPGQPCMLYIVDLRNVHGVLMAVVAEGQEDTDAAAVEAARMPSLPPRFARVTKDTSALLLEADETFTQLLGWTIDEMRGHRTLEFIHPDDHELAIANWMEMLSRPGFARRVRLRHRHKDGSWVWLELTNQNRLDDPEHGDVLADLVDISEEMAAQEALRAREQLLGQLAETVPLGLFHVDRTGNLLFANELLAEITGVPLGSRLREQFRRVLPGERGEVDDAVTDALSGSPRDLTVSIELADGAGVRHCALRMRPLLDSTGAVSGVTGCIEDVTDSVRMREELVHRATRDPLTRCLNRAAVLTLLSDVLRAAGRERRRPRRAGTAVVFVDLDRFKPVNDRLGHAAGDELLIWVADRLRASVRGDDAVGRLGGDEFLIVCPGVTSVADATRLAQLIASRLHDEVELGADRVQVGASVGVAWTDDPDADADHVVAAADAAMYEAKRSGRGVPVLA
jgi:diguanylate cyclase (GGDEF)-like protein/PAS domain S-box-containing protein